MARNMRGIGRGFGASVAGVLVSGIVGACSSSSTGSDGGLYTDSGKTGGNCTQGSLINDGKGNSLKTFCPPGDPGPGAIYVSASGETLSLVGFLYPPAPPPDDTWMVDGWNFHLDAYITVFTNVTIWSDPNESPSNQLLHGPQVTQINGPWVVDLHKGGPLAGQAGMGEEATPIGVIPASALGSTCANEGSCGFGFSTIAAPASYDAYNVNLDATENAYYAYMVQNGYSVLYVGTATWAGTEAWTSDSDCNMSNPECTVTNPTPSEPYKFVTSAGYPASVNFMLGFATPTNYVNCQNGSEFPGQPGIGGEDHPRGIQTSSSGSVPAQVTIHMDHPFWESFAENSPLHWDNIVSQFIGAPEPITVHTEDLKGVNFTSFHDNKGDAVPVRNCSSTCYTPLNDNPTLNYDPLTVPVCIGNTAEAAAGKCLGSYFDFIRYSQSTQGHLNSQGFCFVDRQYPSPGGSSVSQ